MLSAKNKGIARELKRRILRQWTLVFGPNYNLNTINEYLSIIQEKYSQENRPYVIFLDRGMYNLHIAHPISLAEEDKSFGFTVCIYFKTNLPEGEFEYNQFKKQIDQNFSVTAQTLNELQQQINSLRNHTHAAPPPPPPSVH